MKNMPLQEQCFRGIVMDGFQTEGALLGQFVEAGIIAQPRFFHKEPAEALHLRAGIEAGFHTGLGLGNLRIHRALLGGAWIQQDYFTSVTRQFRGSRRVGRGH